MKSLVLAQTESRLLRSQGFSILHIAKQLGVAKSSVSVWVRDVVLDTSARALLEERVKQNHKKIVDRHAFTRTFAQLSYFNLGAELVSRNSFTCDICKMILASIWWCEGAKNFTSVCFTNSDPNLISLFLGLFHKSFICDQSKFRVRMQIHDFHNESELLEFWSKVTGIPKAQFRRSYNKKSRGIFKKEGYKGCIAIYYYDAKIAKELRGVFEATAAAFI